MYFFELQDIIFAVKFLKNPTESVDINNYIHHAVMFSTSNTRSASNLRLNVATQLTTSIGILNLLD